MDNWWVKLPKLSRWRNYSGGLLRFRFLLWKRLKLNVVLNRNGRLLLVVVAAELRYFAQRLVKVEFFVILAHVGLVGWYVGSSKVRHLYFDSNSNYYNY